MSYSPFTFAGGLAQNVGVSLTPPTGVNWLVKSYSLYQIGTYITAMYLDGVEIDASSIGTVQRNNANIVVGTGHSITFNGSGTAQTYSMTGVTV